MLVEENISEFSYLNYSGEQTLVSAWPTNNRQILNIT